MIVYYCSCKTVILLNKVFLIDWLILEMLCDNCGHADIFPPELRAINVFGCWCVQSSRNTSRLAHVLWPFSAFETVTGCQVIRLIAEQNRMFDIWLFTVSQTFTFKALSHGNCSWMIFVCRHNYSKMGLFEYITHNSWPRLCKAQVDLTHLPIAILIIQKEYKKEIVQLAV